MSQCVNESISFYPVNPVHPVNYCFDESAGRGLVPAPTRNWVELLDDYLINKYPSLAACASVPRG
ncbi:MAG: hypothetical protein WCB68_01235, partial [Pyrinomonadaceae bacterium]